MLTMPINRPTERDFPVVCSAGEFTLSTRPPSYRERLEDDARGFQAFNSTDPGKAYADQVTRRLETCVVGWSGVVDDGGQPVPFSTAALIGLLTSVPDAAAAVSHILNAVYAEDVAALGKFDGPPGDSGGGSEPKPPEASSTTSSGDSSPTAAA